MKRFMAAVLAAVAVTVGASNVRANDAQIAQQIVSQLRQQQEAANLKGFNIGVQVDQGTVTMLGQVASSEQATLALEVARRIPGVRLVINDLQVASVVTASMPAAPAPRPMPAQARMAEAQMAAHYAGPPAAHEYGQQSILRPQPVGSGAAASRTRAAQPRVQSPAPGPVAFARTASHRAQPAAASQIIDQGYHGGGQYIGSGSPMPTTDMGGGYGYGYGSGVAYDNPQMPGYSWPSYAAYPNYGAVSYPNQYSAAAWPYIGPFYPYPQVPLGWRKVMLEWDDGWWFLDFKSK